MLILKFILMVFLGCIAGFIQWMYAKANYPSSWQWKTFLFLSGGIACGLAVSLLPFADATIFEKLLLIGGGSLFGGYLLLTALPEKMQMIIPKKE